MIIDRQYFDTLLSYLGNYPEDYFLIGGFAAALNIEQYNGEFRATKDFDMVLVSKMDNPEFASQLVKMIIDGGYENKYTNNKKTAYRFEHPKSNQFPKIIEFFVEEGKYPQSLDNKLAKINIEINEQKISAIVLDKDFYSFALRHIIEIDNIPTLDIYSLIVLKAFAYFKNKKLYEEHAINKNDYLKHRRDIIRLLMLPNEKNMSNDIPPSLMKSIRDFLPVLESSEEITKEYHVSLQTIITVYKAVFGLK